MDKKILYIDMDGTLVDFKSGIDRLSAEQRETFAGRMDEVPGIFSLMDPMEGAIEAFSLLAENFDTYILSTAPWENPLAWAEKLLWVKRCLGAKAYKRLILSHHKELNKGHFLIDDMPGRNGSDKFEEELIEFGSKKFPTWQSVVDYLMTVKDR